MRFMIANFLLALLPPTRLFGLKRRLLRMLGIILGKGTSICGGVQFFGGGRVLIGRDCWIGINTKFYTSPNGNVTIGDFCDIAPDTCFMNGSHEMGDSHRRAGAGRSQHIEVGPGTWIGVRSILLGGSQIGPGCMIAAGSLVLDQKVEANTLLAGIPARVIRQLEA